MISSPDTDTVPSSSSRRRSQTDAERMADIESCRITGHGLTAYQRGYYAKPDEPNPFPPGVFRGDWNEGYLQRRRGWSLDLTHK